jgi:hypothetical protein
MPRLFLLLPLSLLAAGCGSTTTKTVTVTQTRTVTVAAATTQPATPADAGATGDAPQGENGPSGTVALDGSYRIQVVEARGANVGGDALQEPVRWRMATTCSATKCTLSIHRQLAKGGYKDINLEQDGDEPDEYVGTSLGNAQCGGTTTPVRQTLRLRALTPRDDGSGRLTAQTVEAYMRAPITCGTQPRSLSLYRGTLDD